MTPLYGHHDEATAYVVEDYPYGFRLRTRIRYWIETAAPGDRLCSQTLNPKTGLWNKPKKSTYTGVGILALDPDGHVSWTGIRENTPMEAIESFQAEHLEHLLPRQRRRLAAIIGYTRAMEHVSFSIRESTGWTPEQRAEADRQERIAQAEVARAIHAETTWAAREIKAQ